MNNTDALLSVPDL